MFRSNTCADFYGRARSPTPGERKDRKKKSVLECRQKWCIKCFRRSRIGAKTDPRRRSDRYFCQGRGEGGGNISKPWTISTNQVRVYKYKRRNGNELLRSMINVSQRDIVIARGTGLGTWRRCAPMRSTAEWKNNVGDKVLFASLKRW